MIVNDPTAAITPAESAPTSAVNPHTKSGLSNTESAAMAQWAKEDLAKGKITPEQAEKIFTELNTPLEQRGPDTRTDEQKNLDTQVPSAKPEDYRIAYADSGQNPPEMTKELKEFDTSARTWLSSAGFPRETGNSLVTTIAKVAQQTQHMTPDQLEQYGFAQFEKLQKAHGPALEEKLRAVDRMVQVLEAKQPGLVRLLKSKGIMDNAMVANMLIAHAQIFHARKR